MKRTLATLIATLALVLVLVPLVGAAQPYFPVTDIERDYMKAKWEVYEYEDKPYDYRITYFLDGDSMATQVIKRYVKFFKSEDLGIELGADFVAGGWKKTRNTYIALELFYVKTVTPEVITPRPVILFTEREQKPVQVQFEETPAAREVIK